MSGEVIITIVAVIAIVLVFGIPLYALRRRNRIRDDETEEETTSMSSQLEVTPVNNAEPQLTQAPVVTSAPIAAETKPVRPVRKRSEKKAMVAPVAEKKATSRRKKTDPTQASLNKLLKSLDNIPAQSPVLSKEFAMKHGLRLDVPKVKTKKNTTVKKSAPKSKKTK
jgi:hypothetical protein